MHLHKPHSILGPFMSPVHIQDNGPRDQGQGHDPNTRQQDSEVDKSSNGRPPGQPGSGQREATGK